MRRQKVGNDNYRLFSRKTNIDFVLCALAGANKPLTLRQLRTLAPTPIVDERGLKRLIQLGILQRSQERVPKYELDSANPAYQELRGFLRRLSGKRPDVKLSQSPGNLHRYRAGLARLFGGKDATIVLLALANGPVARAAVICGHSNLEPPLRMWIRMGVISQQIVSSRRRRCVLDHSFEARGELSTLLKKIVALYGDLLPFYLTACK